MSLPPLNEPHDADTLVLEPEQGVSPAPAAEEVPKRSLSAWRDEHDKQTAASERGQNEDIHRLRLLHAWLLFGLTVVWVIVLWLFLAMQGFGRWFTPLLKSFAHLKFHLSDTVIVAFMTSTTATVLGLYGIAAYWMYKGTKGLQSSKSGGTDKVKPEALDES